MNTTTKTCGPKASKLVTSSPHKILKLKASLENYSTKKERQNEYSFGQKKITTSRKICKD